MEGAEDDIRATYYILAFQREFNDNEAELRWKVVDMMVVGGKHACGWPAFFTHCIAMCHLYSLGDPVSVASPHGFMPHVIHAARNHNQTMAEVVVQYVLTIFFCFFVIFCGLTLTLRTVGWQGKQ